MRVAPVSADLLVKLALGAALIGGVLYALKKAADAASGPLAAVGAALDTINPLNNNNVFATAANDAASWAAGRPTTLGGEIRSAFSDDDARIRAMLAGEVYGTADGRAAQQWDVTPSYSGATSNNPSAYSADTGAAFGIYPRH